MKKFIKNNIKLFIGIIIGILLCGGTIYAANSFNANEIPYTSNGQSTVEGAINDLYTRANTWLNPATMTASKSITSNGTYDITNYKSASVNVPNTNTTTYTPTSRSASLDMGATNTYRYVNTNSVPNTNSATYTPSSNGTALDMGATNTYRYVNTSTVYNSGVSAGESNIKATWIDPNFIAFGSLATNTRKTVLASSVGVCIKKNNKVNCFKKSNFSSETSHIRSVFSGASCEVYSNLVDCTASDFRCWTRSSDGAVSCLDKVDNSGCAVGGSSVSCT